MLEEHSVITIVLVADLHSTVYRNDQAILITMIQNANPDVIVLAGDIYDSAVPPTGVRLLLSGISGIAPVYFVTGNHEYASGNIRAIREELLSFGVIILSDNYVSIVVQNNEIILAGIEDPEKQLDETPDYHQINSMEAAFRKLDETSLFKILIAHRPEMIEVYKNYSFDLVLSGHTHGGQVRFLCINGLYAPHQGLFPKYAGGIYHHENLTHIVSRGLSRTHPRLPRIFNPPELVVIQIDRRSE